MTNKHVISNKKSEREALRDIIFHININNENGIAVGDTIKYKIAPDSWKEHPDPDTDVIVFDITGFVIGLRNQYNKSIVMKPILPAFLATSELIKRYDIKIGDEILVIGYPSLYGLKHQNTNFPMVRQGIIASNIGEPLADKIRDEYRTRLIKAFLVDGAIIPGSSGSPVIVKPLLFRSIGGNYVSDYFPPLLIGIISEYRNIHTPNFESFANLGLAFDASTILETLNLF